MKTWKGKWTPKVVRTRIRFTKAGWFQVPWEYMLRHDPANVLTLPQDERRPPSRSSNIGRGFVVNFLGIYGGRALRVLNPGRLLRASGADLNRTSLYINCHTTACIHA